MNKTSHKKYRHLYKILKLLSGQEHPTDMEHDPQFLAGYAILSMDQDTITKEAESLLQILDEKAPQPITRKKTHRKEIHS